VVSKGVVLLVIFTPLAFGTVEPWSISIMELAAFGLFLLHAGTHGVPLPEKWPARAILLLFALLIGLVLLQLLPLPDGILGLVSPAALGVWRQFGSDPPGGFHTASLYPDATRREVLKLLAYAAVFFVVAGHFRTRARIMLLARTILFMGGFLAAVAIAQRLTWNGRILWFYPVEEALRSGSGIWGPYVNRNHFAGYLAMALPIGLGLLVHALPDALSQRGIPWSRRFGRFLASGSLAPCAGVFLLVLLMSACLLATLSRGGIAACAVSWLFFAWVAHRRRSLRGKVFQLGLAAAAIVAVVALPSWDRIAPRFQDSEQTKPVSRLHLLEDAVGIARDFPLLGTGLGTFDQSYRRYQTRNPRLRFDHAHNDYAELATETGAVGFLLAGGSAAIFVLALVRGWRQRHGQLATCVGAGGMASCLALAVHSGVDFNLHIPANALLFAVIAGLTHAAIFSPSGSALETPAAAAPRPALAKLRFGLAAAPFAALLLWLPAREFVADYHFRQVARSLDDLTTAELDVKPLDHDTLPSYGKAVASLKRSAALAPLRSAYPLALADLYATMGSWAQTMQSLRAPLPAGALSGAEALALAVAEARRATRLEPTNPDLHLALGRLYAEVDRDFARADPQIRLALAAHPVNAPLRLSAAALYLQAGRRADALEQARVLARIDDSYLIPESAQKTVQIERRAAGYLAVLKGSYLFRALEIAWRASGDVDLVKGIAPQTDDARAVVALFLEWRGIEG
jgi:O-antigen ligase